jgi:hypothetical protein
MSTPSLLLKYLNGDSVYSQSIIVRSAYDIVIIGSISIACMCLSLLDSSLSYPGQLPTLTNLERYPSLLMNGSDL